MTPLCLQVHSFWRSLVAGEVPDATDISKLNVSVEGSPERVERSDAAALLSKAPARGLPQPIPLSGQCHAHVRLCNCAHVIT